MVIMVAVLMVFLATDLSFSCHICHYCDN
jgi:hypothetical protein